jgi:hypothetical protein
MFVERARGSVAPRLDSHLARHFLSSSGRFNSASASCEAWDAARRGALCVKVRFPGKRPGGNLLGHLAIEGRMLVHCWGESEEPGEVESGFITHAVVLLT